jgi:hypothetical protein
MVALHAAACLERCVLLGCSYRSEVPVTSTAGMTHKRSDRAAPTSLGQCFSATRVGSQALAGRSLRTTSSCPAAATLGKTWSANIGFTAAPGTSLANIFPALALDPAKGNLYAVWSDGRKVEFSGSTDQGALVKAPDCEQSSSQYGCIAMGGCLQRNRRCGLLRHECEFGSRPQR